MPQLYLGGLQLDEATCLGVPSTRVDEALPSLMVSTQLKYSGSAQPFMASVVGALVNVGAVVGAGPHV